MAGRDGSAVSTGYKPRRDRVPEILARVDLPRLVIEVAGPAVRGFATTSANFHCPSPHHSDANPSFTVKGERWRCWSQCGVGGNAIDLVIFVGLAKNTAEAIEFLARRVGVPA